MFLLFYLRLPHVSHCFNFAICFFACLDCGSNSHNPRFGADIWEVLGTLHGWGPLICLESCRCTWWWPGLWWSEGGGSMAKFLPAGEIYHKGASTDGSSQTSRKGTPGREKRVMLCPTSSIYSTAMVWIFHGQLSYSTQNVCLHQSDFWLSNAETVYPQSWMVETTFFKYELISRTKDVERWNDSHVTICPTNIDHAVDWGLRIHWLDLWALVDQMGSPRIVMSFVTRLKPVRQMK